MRLFWVPLLTIALIGLATGLWMRRARSIDPARFRRELLARGVYDLPCGGGPLVDVPPAARSLRWSYGKERVLDLSLATCRAEALKDEVSCLTFQLACGVLYELGDAAVVDRLVTELRSLPGADEVVSGAGQPAYRSRGYRRQHLEKLAAGLCRRLDRPCPPGIKPLTELEESQ